MESQLRNQKPRIIYVAGGPGSGKGTQCAIMVKELGYNHTSIGDLMRAEIKAGSQEGKAVEAIVKSGNLVPKELTVSLLLKALQKMKANTILIDGFPRSNEQAVYLEQITQPIDYILLFDTDQEDVLVNRLIERGLTSGRADDKAETIRYRFQVYKNESAPVISLYDPFNVIRRVECLAPIEEVTKRTIKALRPEVYFVIGPKFSGKSSVSSYLVSRFQLHYISLDEVKRKGKGKNTVTLTNDYEIADALINTLQQLRNQYRVVVEGFPENLIQAKRFTKILGDPNRVIYLKCSKDVAQQRLLAIGKQSSVYICPPEFNSIYEKFSASIHDISNYYKNLGDHYGEVQVNDKEVDYIADKASKIIQPKVIMIRGKMCMPFLKYIEAKGYKLVNACHLLVLWREARGLSNTVGIEEPSDDRELISILKNVLFSGNGVSKFAIYNFALKNASLIMEFEGMVCDISTVYYLYSTPFPKIDDEATHCLFAMGKMHFIDTYKVSRGSNLTDSDKSYFDMAMKEVHEKSRSWAILVIGPTLSGKTEVSNFISQKMGYPLVNYNNIIEETKAFLSTEEEPKESLTYSEFLGGVQRYLEKFSNKFLVFDGLPPAEQMFAGKDETFPEFQAPEGEIDEETAINMKSDEVAKRANAFIEKLPLLLTIELECPMEMCEKRYRERNEVNPDDPLPAEGRKEILETIKVHEKISKGSDLIPHRIPRCLAVDSSSKTLPQIKNSILSNLERRVILVRESWLPPEVLSMFYWKNQLFHIEMQTILQKGESRLDDIGEKLRRGVYDPKIRVELIKEEIESRPLRDTIIIISGFEVNETDEYLSSLEELMLIEREIGRVQALITFSDELDEVDIEMIPVRKRKPKINKEKEEEDKDEKDEKSSDEEEQKSISIRKEIEEVPEEVHMWNNSQRSNFSKVFHHYQGVRSQLRRVELKGEDMLSTILKTLRRVIEEKDIRWNIQFLLDDSDSRILQSEVLGIQYPPTTPFQQILPLDIRNLGKK